MRVQVKYDAKQAKYEGMAKALRELKRAKIRCHAISMQPDYACMHHKFMVIDQARVLTGSFNFTAAASTVNYENLVQIESAAVAAQFTREFDAIEDRK